jgi:hypothetical protein
VAQFRSLILKLKGNMEEVKAKQVKVVKGIQK